LSPPLQAQVPAAALLAAVAEIVLEDSYIKKLQDALPLHRVLVVFLTSNPAGYVVDPCLRMTLKLLSTETGNSFAASFETEGGFDILNNAVPNIWTSDIQKQGESDLLRLATVTHGSQPVFDILHMQLLNKAAANQLLFPGIVSALEKLLQNAFEEDSASTSGRPTSARGSNQSGLAVSFGSSPSLPSMVRREFNDRRGSCDLTDFS
jgi:hypothetical protein